MRGNGCGMGSDCSGAHVFADTRRAVSDMLRSFGSADARGQSRMWRLAPHITRTSAQVAHTVRSAHTHPCKCTMVYLPLTSQSQASRALTATQRHTGCIRTARRVRFPNSTFPSRHLQHGGGASVRFHAAFWCTSPIHECECFDFIRNKVSCAVTMWPAKRRFAIAQPHSRHTSSKPHNYTNVQLILNRSCTPDGHLAATGGRAARTRGSGFAVRQSVLCYVGLPVYSGR